MYEIWVEDHVRAFHSLRFYQGKTERRHAHNFRVRVTLRGKRLQNKVKYVVDFRAVQAALRSVLKVWRRADLNRIPPFHKENPSAEMLAREVARQISRTSLPPGVRVASVTVWESPRQAARFILKGFS